MQLSPHHIRAHKSGEDKPGKEILAQSPIGINMAIFILQGQSWFACIAEGMGARKTSNVSAYQ